MSPFVIMSVATAFHFEGIAAIRGLTIHVQTTCGGRCSLDALAGNTIENHERGNSVSKHVRCPIGGRHGPGRGFRFRESRFRGNGLATERGLGSVQISEEIAKNPGRVARFRGQSTGRNIDSRLSGDRHPRTLTLALDYGWGWGDANQGADSVSFLLLNAEGNGYAFKIHRCKATWAVQWGRATQGAAPKDMNWATVDIDATHTAVRDGGGLTRVTIRREPDATWTIRNPDWNRGRRHGPVHGCDNQLVQPVGTLGNGELRRATVQSRYDSKPNRERPSPQRPSLRRRFSTVSAS